MGTAPAAGASLAAAARALGDDGGAGPLTISTCETAINPTAPLPPYSAGMSTTYISPSRETTSRRVPFLTMVTTIAGASRRQIVARSGTTRTRDCVTALEDPSARDRTRIEMGRRIKDRSL